MLTSACVLQSLKLGNNSFSDSETVSILARCLKSNRYLSALELWRNGLNTAAFKSLADGLVGSALISLDLSGLRSLLPGHGSGSGAGGGEGTQASNHVMGKEGAAALVPLLSHKVRPNLVRGTCAVAALLCSACLLQLQVLMPSWALLQSPLRHLYLEGVGSAGLATLARALVPGQGQGQGQAPPLQTLDVANNELKEDEVVEILALLSRSQLRYLRLAHNKLNRT